MLKFATYAAAAAAFVAVPASAATFLTVSNGTPASCGVGDMNCTFKVEGRVETNGAFTLTSNQFSLPRFGTFSISATNTSAGGTNIDFTGAVLKNITTSTSYTGYFGNPGTFSFANVDASTGNGTFELTVTGTSMTANDGTVFPEIGGSGDFRATARPPAVPEPATWALFILGFGAIGQTMRRRSAKVHTAKAKLNFA